MLLGGRIEIRSHKSAIERRRLFYDFCEGRGQIEGTMARLYWTVGATVAVLCSALTVSAQPMFGAGRQGMPPPYPPVFQLPGGDPPLSPFPPPPPPIMALGAAGLGMPPFPAPGIEMGRFGWPTLADVCLDMLAERAGILGYLKARLNLTPEQASIWQDFETAATDGEQEEQQACAKASAKPEEQTVVQRIDAGEERLARRLTRIRNVGAPLRKLIAALSPEQLRVVKQSMSVFPF